MSNETSADDYLLRRDYLDCTRLNLQHYLWIQMFGYMVHPFIDLKKENLKVADVATGTGIFLTDLARQLPPSSQLDGFDIDLSQAPPSKWLPENVHLHKWDIFSELPDSMVGQYDVVNIKLLIVVVKDNARELVQKFCRMLKPGGFLQWSEPDIETMHFERTEVDNDATAMTEIFALTSNQDTRLAPQLWPSQLADLFKQEGLTDVVNHRIESTPDLAYNLYNCNLMLYEMFAHSAAKGESQTKILGLLPKVAAETRKGAMMAHSKIFAVGRKLVSK